MANHKLIKPSQVYISPEIFENNVTVNWVKSNENTDNSVVGYIIHYRKSRDSSGWGVWTHLVDVSAVDDEYSFSSSLSRGEYIQFRVRAKSYLGDNYNSDWTISDIGRKNSLPSIVSNFLISNNTYRQGEDITLSWNSASDIDDAVNSYEIEYSKNNKAWIHLVTLTSLLYKFKPESIGNGEFIKFRICAIDKNNAKSDYTESQILKRIDGNEVYVCINGIYKRCSISVCDNDIFKEAKLFVAQNKQFKNS